MWHNSGCHYANSIHDALFVRLPVSAAGLVTVLYWFCVEMMLDLGLRAGEDNKDNSSMMPQLRGWFLGNSLRRCSKEYRRRSSFWLDSLKRAWAWKQGGRLEKKAKREGRWEWMETLVTWHFFPRFCFGGTQPHWGIGLYDENLDPTTKHLPLSEPFFLSLFPTPGVSSRFWLPRPQQTLSWRGDTALPPAGPAD